MAIITFHPSAFFRLVPRILAILILLGGTLVKTRLPTAQAATGAIINVNTTIDEFGEWEGSCSLREAIQAANTDTAFGGCPAGSGADVINLPNGTFQLTIPNISGLNEDANATGDLDINASLTITGANKAITIIQAGTNNTDGIDKVLGVNPTCSNGVSVTIENVTIRYGLNTQIPPQSDFSFTGGGLDWCGGTGTGAFTLRNSIVSDNTNVNSYGGGMNIDSITGYTGNITITNVSFLNNRTLSTTNEAHGGGLNIWGYMPNITITNSIFSGNQVANPDSRGGGINYRPSYGGSLTIHSSIIQSNDAAGNGGGISIYPSTANTTLTIDQNTQINYNAAGGNGGGIYLGGASENTTPFNLSNLLISGNMANATGMAGGGVYNSWMIANMQYSRIVSNTAAVAGSGGLAVDNGTVTATENWWGCNSGPGGACNGALLIHGSLTTSPYLKLNLTADPETVTRSQPSTLTGDFLTDSGLNPVNPTNLGVLTGLPVIWGVINATLSDQQMTIQTGGTATASLINNANCNNSSVFFTVDSTTLAKIVILQCIDLTITKTHTDPFIRGDVGDTYTITVTNTGTGPTSGLITVVDELPAGLTATGLSGTGWECVLGTLTCTRSDALAVGGFYPGITLTVDVLFTAAGSVTNSVTVSGGGDATPDNNTADDLTNIPLLKFFLPMLLAPLTIP